MNSKIFIYITIMAAITYASRAIPIVMMKKQIESKFIKSFLHYVPFAVLASMTFPSILYSTGNLYTGLAGLTVGVILAYFNKGLMTVAIFSVLAVYSLSFLKNLK